VNANGTKVFTAKARNSKYFYCRYRNNGFRFANMRHPMILTSRITDSNRVPIEYDFVPTELTGKFFGKAKRIKGFASFTYFDGEWLVNFQ